MNNHPTIGGAGREPALSENFAARVIARVRVERRRQKYRRRAALAAALAIAGGLAFFSIRAIGPAGNSAPLEVAPISQWNDSDAAQTVGGYFFPDAGAIESYGANFQGGAPSLGDALGFYQGTILPAAMTESDGD